LLAPEEFWAIGQFYEDFTQVDDEEVIEILCEFAAAARAEQPGMKSAVVSTGTTGKGPQPAR
jgi:hypothetical protein